MVVNGGNVGLCGLPDALSDILWPRILHRILAIAGDQILETAIISGARLLNDVTVRQAYNKRVSNPVVSIFMT